MELSKQNLIDAIQCVNKSCVECSMLGEKKACLDSCIAIVASTALELYEQNKQLKQQIFNSINQTTEEGAKGENELCEIDSRPNKSQKGS